MSKVRFAPSPTGRFAYIGGIELLLYNYLFASSIKEHLF
ncbi:MAG: hypothetical protein IPI90_10395 [Saprospiraceae bacterium]|nr:hypothetical protein [Candidatus Vicinibacter affinis]